MMWSFSPLCSWSLRGSLMFLSTFSLVLCLILNGVVIALMYLLGYNGRNSTTFSDSSTPVYNILLSMVIVGFAGASVCAFGIWAAKRVRLHLIVVFFWMSVMLIGCFFVFAVITFDFQSNVRNFIRQHWVQSPLGFARKISCEKGTADSLCTVPIIGYPYASQDEWCLNTYQSNECASIQVDAIDFFFDWVVILMNVVGAILIFLMLDMALAMFISAKLVGVPIIMLSMQAVSSYILMIPATAMILHGLLIIAMEDFYLTDSWVKYLSFSISALLFCCAILGAISGHVRHPVMLKVYVGCLSFVLVVMIIVLGLVIYTMIQFSLVFENKLDAEVWEDSCKSGLYNCCCCITDDTEDNLYPPPACPEWTTGNVSDLCQAFLTLVALSTTLCLAFVVCSIFVATLLYRNLKAYEVVVKGGDVSSTIYHIACTRWRMRGKDYCEVAPPPDRTAEDEIRALQRCVFFFVTSLAYHEHSDPKSLTFKCDLEGYPTLWRMPADEWDDSAILKAFELALKGEDNRSVKTKNEEESEFEKADKRFQSLLKKGHESGPGLWKSTTEGAADYPGVSRTGPTPPPSSSVPPIGGGGAFPPDFLVNSLQSVQGGALQDMLLAWYYSGYYTGRYQAIQEMQNGQTPEDADQ